MEVITITIPSPKDAQLIRGLLKKFKGIKIHNGTNVNEPSLPVAPISKAEFRERIKNSEKEAKEGNAITGSQLKKEMYKWREIEAPQ